MTPTSRAAPPRSIPRQPAPDAGAGDHAPPLDQVDVFTRRLRETRLARAYLRALDGRGLDPANVVAHDVRAVVDAGRQLADLVEDPQLEGLLGERFATTALPRAYLRSIQDQVLDPAHVPAHDPTAMYDAAVALLHAIDEVSGDREGL